MATAEKRIEQRVQQLEREGAEPLRIQALNRAQRFKRSWVEMAEVLLEVRDHASFEAWGYKDLHHYCSEELLLRRKTVDKLVGSFVALKRHAPERLAKEQTLPTFDAVDYFARAMGESANDPPPHGEELSVELERAVFDELEPVTALRKRFDPVLYPQSDEEREQRRLERVGGASRRLRETVARIEGIPAPRVAVVTAALEGLERDLEQLMSGVARAS